MEVAADLLRLAVDGASVDERLRAARERKTPERAFAGGCAADDEHAVGVRPGSACHPLGEGGRLPVTRSGDPRDRYDNIVVDFK